MEAEDSEHESETRSSEPPPRPVITTLDRQSLTNVIGDEIVKGRSLASICEVLVERGVEADAAAQLVESIAEYRENISRSWERIERAQRCKRRGAMYFVGGLLLVVVAIGVTGGLGAGAMKLLILVVPYGAIQYWRGTLLLQEAMRERDAITSAWYQA